MVLNKVDNHGELTVLSHPQIIVPYFCLSTVMSGFGAATNHTQTHTLIRVNEVAEVFTRSRYRDSLLISKFVQSALNTKICFPVLAVSYKPPSVQKMPGKTGYWIIGLPAPPAMVPSRNLLISMTFLTVPEAMVFNY